MLRRLRVAPLLFAALALQLAAPLRALGQEAAAAADGTAGGVRCSRAAPGAAGHPAAAADATAGVAAAHALLLPGPHLRLLRRHADTGLQLRPDRVHEPHVRPVRVRAGGRRADGRRLSLPADHVSEEPAAVVHAGADPVRAVYGHVHAAVGRVHAGAEPARVSGHGGAPAEGARARAALRLHGDGARRRGARQAGRGGPAARRRADGGGRRRRHLRRGDRGPQAGVTGDSAAGPVAGAAAAQVRHQDDEATLQALSHTRATVESVDEAKTLSSPATESNQQHAPLKASPLSTKFVTAEQHQMPVVRKGIIGALHGSRITNIYSRGKPIKYIFSPSVEDNGNATGGITIAVNDLVNKSEGLMAAFLSYLRGAQVHSGPHVPPNGTATNVIKKNTVTKTVIQHLAHEEHSNETVTTSSERPTLFNGTKVTAKFEEKTTTASKIYAHFEAHNSTIQEYNETVHAIKFPPVRKFVFLPNNTLDYQKNSAAFAIFSPSGKPNNPFSIIFPLLHIGVAHSLMNPLTRITSLKDDTSTLTCLQSSLGTGNRVKCLKENGGPLSGRYNKTNEIAHGSLGFRAQHVRVKRSSDFSPAHILATSAGESSRDVELRRPDGSGMDQQSQTSKYLPSSANKPDFPTDGTRWTSDDGEASRHHTGTDLLPRDFGFQARQAWGSMLGIMWCAAGVLFSGPSFWNVMACLLQAGQAFIG